MSGLVAHVPSRRTDETLSSILLRLAHNHSASANEICALLWPSIEFWTRDIDRTASNAVIAMISDVTGIEVPQLECATLRGLVERLGLPQMRCGSQEGILPVGVYHRLRRSFGQQFCPRCLDEHPAYLRRLWRLEFVVSCPRHGTLLRDACPNCGFPFIPHRAHAMIQRRCHRCGRKLTGGESISTERSAINLQQTILSMLVESSAADTAADKNDTLVSPYWELVTSAGQLAFIDGVRRLCRLATRARTRYPRGSGGNMKVWALMRTPERAEVMALVGQWLEDWPKAWINWADTKDITRHYLTSEFGPWPDWVMLAMASLPYSHGPVNVRRSRWPIRLSELRKQYVDMSAYREARAHLLLKKAIAMLGTVR